MPKKNSNILNEILTCKREALEARKKELPLKGLENILDKCFPPFRFRKAISEENSTGDKARIIAEVKKASPSKGILLERFNPLEIALKYEENGAKALSVLTEEHYFLGSLKNLHKIAKSTVLPVMRKDFILDEYEVLEARAYRSDAFLLIARILKETEIERLRCLGEDLGMDAMVEVRNIDDLEKALGAGSKIIGINNRNLKSFETDLNTTVQLYEHIPKDKIVVSESGLNTRYDLEKLQKLGIDAFLIGEALVTAQDIGEKLRELIGS